MQFRNEMQKAKLGWVRPPYSQTRQASAWRKPYRDGNCDTACQEALTKPLNARLNTLPSVRHPIPYQCIALHSCTVTHSTRSPACTLQGVPSARAARQVGCLCSAAACLRTYAGTRRHPMRCKNQSLQPVACLIATPNWSTPMSLKKSLLLLARELISAICHCTELNISKLSAHQPAS